MPRYWLLLVLAAWMALVQCPLSLGQSQRLGQEIIALKPAMSGAPSERQPAAPVERNSFYRPIALIDGNRHWADRSYAYGSTQWGRRPAHLGVEFVNPRGTPVYAAKAGTVVFAGRDDATLIGPRLGHYGKVVILAHDLASPAGRQVFTLYAHLDQVDVELGDRLADLERLGRVGASGAAIGAHLHFELRVDDAFDYGMTRNPELWLQHYVGHGMIVGAVRDADGQHIPGKRIALRGPGLRRDVYSYSGDIVNADPLWDENFTISDLPAGDYRLVVLSEGGAIAFAETVTVEAYKTSAVEIIMAAD